MVIKQILHWQECKGYKKHLKTLSRYSEVILLSNEVLREGNLQSPSLFYHSSVKPIIQYYENKTSLFLILHQLLFRPYSRMFCNALQN